MAATRTEALRRLQIANGIDCVAFLPGASFRYFTGLATHLSERPMVAFLPKDGVPAILLPELEEPGTRANLAAGETLPGETALVTYTDEEGHEAAFHKAAGALKLEGKTIGVEYLSMRMMEMRRIQQAAPGCRFLATEPWLPALRMAKDAAEIAHMRKAVEIAERAMDRLLAEDAVRAGRSELDVAADLQIALLGEGSQGDAFRPIVVAGPNSASPHKGPSDRLLSDGDLVVIDWGAVVEGYRSDITRTFVIGQAAPEFQRVHDAVLAANQSGRLAARPGIPAQDVDRHARRAIVAAGYGSFFIHRTGHGLGLETHEPPYIVEGDLEILRQGMTFTVEPGIYLPGVGGVRIEDDVLVTENGHETLTTLPRELRQVG